MTSQEPPVETADDSPLRSSVLAIARLALVAAYSLLLLVIDAMHFEAQVDGVLIGLVGVPGSRSSRRIGSVWRGPGASATTR
ncbi:MAG: hypothetical protein FJW85_01455 [Actinobacteria bacterium]|nr:hypothetical protein [Actinomycetota bacterium]